MPAKKPAKIVKRSARVLPPDAMPRLEALRLATGKCHGTADEIVAYAEAFLAFLTGKEKARQ